MRKILSFTVCAFLVSIAFFAIAVGNFNPILKASADIVTSAKLEYFELNNPLLAVRDSNKVYIAEKDRIIIYCDDVYHEIVLNEQLPDCEFDVKNIAKCASNLLILSNNTLYALNLSTFTLNQVIFENDNGIDFTKVSSFSVCENYFAINDLHCQTFLFEMNDDGVKLNCVYDYTLEPSPHLALADDNSIYYFCESQLSLRYIFSPSAQGYYQNIVLNEVDCFAFSQNLYYKTNDIIYKVGNDLSKDTPQQVVNLNDFDIYNSGSFSISNDKILICDTQNDRVLEYDLIAQNLTDFEISFTKIKLPNDFSLLADFSPRYISVNQNELLYDINLPLSLQKGYFVFNGYHTQKETGDYLIVATINDLYYLVSGEVFALVLKENFQAEALEKVVVNKQAYLSSTANLYIQPELSSEFTCFKIDKLSSVEVLFTVEICSVEYAIVKQGENTGYIPTSFLIYELESLPEYKSFETALIGNKQAKVYSDKELSTVQDTLKPFAQVLITEKDGEVYKVIYDGKVGYVASKDISRRGAYTNKIVTVVLLLALSLFSSAIYFEIKYLYTKKKTIFK